MGFAKSPFEPVSFGTWLVTLTTRLVESGRIELHPVPVSKYDFRRGMTTAITPIALFGCAFYGRTLP